MSKNNYIIIKMIKYCILDIGLKYELNTKDKLYFVDKTIKIIYFKKYHIFLNIIKIYNFYYMYLSIVRYLTLNHYLNN